MCFQKTFSDVADAVNSVGKCYYDRDLHDLQRSRAHVPPSVLWLTSPCRREITRRSGHPIGIPSAHDRTLLIWRGHLVRQVTDDEKWSSGEPSIWSNVHQGVLTLFCFSEPNYSAYTRLFFVACVAGGRSVIRIRSEFPWKDIQLLVKRRRYFF